MRKPATTSLRGAVLVLLMLLAAAPAGANSTTRESLRNSGVQAGGSSGVLFRPAVSSDGRFVAYSSSQHMVEGDNNFTSDIFVRDRLLGSTARVSVTTSGAESDGISRFPVISADGRFVAFETEGRLAEGDGDFDLDVYVHDQVLRTTTRASVSTTGGAGGVPPHSRPAISTTGRFVTFHTHKPLVEGDTNGLMDVYIRDLQEGTTRQVSLSNGGAQADGHSRSSSVSTDGRFVAFSSVATNLVSGDTNSKSDVFVRDLASGSTTRIGTSSAGGPNGDSVLPVISGDGRFVAFQSAAGDLVGSDTNGQVDLFVHDRQAGTTARVNLSNSGAQTNGSLGDIGPTISADGRFVAFDSTAADLVEGDTNGASDVFVRDRQRGVTARVSVAGSGAQANGASSGAVIGGNGRMVAFGSVAGNLVADDTNGANDVFLHDRTCLGQEPTIRGTPGDDNLAGTAGVDVISGIGGNDTIDGLGGNDVLCGGEGGDSITGGDGADVLAGGLGADILGGGLGTDLVSYADQLLSVVVSIGLGVRDDGSAIVDGVAGAADDVLADVENATGGAGDDLLSGNAVNNTLTGGLGDDRLAGADGHDLLSGGAGDDVLEGGTGRDTTAGGTGTDTASYADRKEPVEVSLGSGTATDGNAADTAGGTGEQVSADVEAAAGGAGDDTLTGDAAANTLVGNGGADTLAGNGSDDVLQGGEGVDQLSGGPGVDTASYADATAPVTVTLGEGTRPDGNAADTAAGQAEQVPADVEGAAGGAGDDTLVGDAGANELDGNGGADTLEGGGAADTLEGDDGDDTLDGGAGADESIGGEGEDTFVSGDGGDTYESRDGTAESITCAAGDTVLNDLVDQTQQPDQCAAVATAARKHRFDTRLLARRLAIRRSGSLTVRVRCPARKTEACTGELSLLRNARSKRPLASRRYRVERGRTKRIVLRLDPTARGLLGRRVTLRAREVDDDRRPRFVFARGWVRAR